MTVKFATVCDHCGARSEEYKSWPSCRECMDDVCPKCSANYDPESNRADCHRCLEYVNRRKDASEMTIVAILIGLAFLYRAIRAAFRS